MKKHWGPSGLRNASACIAVLWALGTSSAPAVAQHVIPTPMNSPARTPPATQSGDAAREVAAFARAWASITGYSATVTIFDQKGTQTQNVVFDYTFRKPSNVTVHVLAGPNAGVTLTWNGGGTVGGRRGAGLGGVFTRERVL